MANSSANTPSNIERIESTDTVEESSEVFHENEEENTDRISNTSNQSEGKFTILNPQIAFWDKCPNNFFQMLNKAVIFQLT